MASMGREHPYTEFTNPEIPVTGESEVPSFGFLVQLIE